MINYKTEKVLDTPLVELHAINIEFKTHKNFPTKVLWTSASQQK